MKIERLDTVCEVWEIGEPNRETGWETKATARTAPLAICLAALKSVGVIVD